MDTIPRVLGMEVAGIQVLMKSLLQSRALALLVSEKGVGEFEFGALFGSNRREEGCEWQAEGKH